MSGINSGHHYLPTYQIWMTSDNVEILPPIFLCGVLVVILKMADILKILKFFNVRNQFGTSLSNHISNFDDIGQYWNFTAQILCHVLAAVLKIADISKILKVQNCSSNGNLSLCQILCPYHYPFRSYQH